MKQKRIPCPHCAELISSEAKKCPFCQSHLKKKSKTSSIIKIIAIVLGGLGLVFIACVIFIVYIMSNIDNKYTGQDLFEAVNNHRKSVGVPELQMDGNLCDNLVERWLAVREPGNGHKGYEEWAEAEGLTKDGVAVEPYKATSGISELYILNATTTDWALSAWIGSPGHKNTLENSDMNSGCAYAHDGTGILIMAEKSL